MVTFRGLIFDFNGVLWWDNALQEKAWRDFSANLRGTPLDDIEMAEHVHGRNNPYTVQYLSGKRLSEAEVKRLGEEKEIIYRRLCLQEGDDFRLSPGAESLLNYLVEQDIAHTIATASGKGNVDFFIEHLQLERWFDPRHIVYDDGSLVGKPAPDFYLAAADRLALPTGQCIVIEDSLSGMRAAKAAGIGRILALIGDAGHALRGQLPGDIGIINDLTELDHTLLLE